MNLKNAPQPIPYQGSKRRQVPLILGFVPDDTEVLREPFAGSAAVTIGAAATNAAKRFVIGDTLEPLVGIWSQIIEQPEQLADDYEAIWESQLDDPRAYYDRLRDRFNAERKPAQLLYLIARCVKNAVRFNSEGHFNQSPDKRRLGMRPTLLRSRVMTVSPLLHGRTSTVCGDYSAALGAASPKDVVYMDPPYMGVSGKRDSRYHQGLDYDRFVAELEDANARGLSYLVSFDGSCGKRTYGPGLPEHLELHRIAVHVGRSSQATLNGREDETVESLYLSPALVDRLEADKASLQSEASVATPRVSAGQQTLFQP